MNTKKQCYIVAALVVIPALFLNPSATYAHLSYYQGKIKAGTLGKPGQNPYSIVPGGILVQAFTRYGWHWSPDMHWSNGADYMHFSRFGTKGEALKNEGLSTRHIAINQD